MRPYKKKEPNEWISKVKNLFKGIGKLLNRQLSEGGVFKHSLSVEIEGDWKGQLFGDDRNRRIFFVPMIDEVQFIKYFVLKEWVKDKRKRKK